VLTGLMYALIAVGFVLIYKSTDAINFAQGEFVMIAAMIVAGMATLYGLPLIVAILISLAFMLVFNWGLEPARPCQRTSTSRTPRSRSSSSSCCR
jgi:branched-chain amino acid transport system permease protein